MSDNHASFTALDTPPRLSLRRAITEPPPNLGLKETVLAPAPMGSLEVMAPIGTSEMSDITAMTPPPAPIDGVSAWAISEKNTFLSVQVPEQLPLLRSNTAPINAASTSEENSSGIGHVGSLPLGAEAGEGLETAPGLSTPLPPPPLSLEFVETYDPFRRSPVAAERLGFLAPPPLSLEYVATDDPFRPIQVAGDSSVPPPPPPLLSLEYVATDDPFRGTPTGARLLPPPGLPLEYIATDDPYRPAHQCSDLAWPPGSPSPPPLLSLESFDTEDPFERPLELISLPTSEPAFVPLPSRPVMCGPPPPPVAPAPLIGTPTPVPPPPPPAQMPLTPAPELEAPCAHDVPMAQPGHTPGASIMSLLATECRQPGILVRSSVEGCTHVHWTLDARKLEGQDKQAVSQVFSVELPGYGPTPFKLVLYPKATNDGKHGAGFRKAKGHGRVVLKCEAQLPEELSDVCFRVGVGRAGKDSQTLQPFRGPAMQNFFEHSCHGLPKSEEDWDFSASVEDSRTALVTLEIAPTSAFRADPGIWWAPLAASPAPPAAPAVAESARNPAAPAVADSTA